MKIKFPRYLPLVGIASLAIALPSTSAQTLESQLGILDLTANSGLNPATGAAWQHGDSYRLVFVSTNDVDSNTAGYDEITAWNALVQGIADAATTHDLSGATWKIIGSTATVDARDNTLTNPDVIGTGHAIFNMDGSSVIENNFVDLWDGNAPVNVALYDQNVVEKGSSSAVDWPFTGTNFDGTAHPNWFLQDTTGGGDIRQGRNQANIGGGAGWIDANNVSSNWNDAGAGFSVYGMSERLFVVDTTDATDPNFSSFADDAGGSPVLSYYPVVYTVTFDEAMLPSTVTADDFDNAGTSTFRIDDVIQLDDPAVFQVYVVPTSVGSLQLEIPAAADLTDLNGNPLDTNAAFIDSTTITVDPGPEYVGWIANYPDISDSAPAVDADTGDVSNSLEWVLGGDPTDPSDDMQILPVEDASDPNNLVFTFNRRDEVPGDTYSTTSIEYGSDLIGWTVAENGTNGVTIDDTVGTPPAGFKTVQVTLPKTLATDDKLFVRLVVDVTLP